MDVFQRLWVLSFSASQMGLWTLFFMRHKRGRKTRFKAFKDILTDHRENYVPDATIGFNLRAGRGAFSELFSFSSLNPLKAGVS